MIEQYSKRETALMLNVYLTQEKAIKLKILRAIQKGNDTAYLQNVLKSIQEDLVKLDKYFKKFSSQKLPDLYKKSTEKVDNQIKAFSAKNGLEFAFNKVDPAVVNVLANNTYKSLSQINTVIGRRTEDIIREIGIKQVQGVAIGAETWQQSARQLTSELKNNNFFSIKYKNGREVPVSTYSKMVARTTSAEAFRAGTRERIKQYGYDLVDVIGKSRFPDSPCIPFEGKTLSLTGETEGYITLAAAVAAGFNHPGCVHDYSFSDKNLELI